MTNYGWLGSLDVMAFVQNQMAREVADIDTAATAQLTSIQNIQQSLTTNLSVYSQVQNLLTGTQQGSLQQTLNQLVAAFNPSYQVSSSNTNVATVQMNSANNTSPVAHTIQVTDIAQGESYASAVTPFSSSTSALGVTNQLTIHLGASNFNVNVGATDSLQTIVSNINSSLNNIGVKASILSTTSGAGGTPQYQLVISTTDTGTATAPSGTKALSITETGMGANSFDLTTELTRGKDAAFTLDGGLQTIYQPSNTINNLVNGLNVTLLEEGSATLSVTTTSPVTNVVTAAQNFVSAYNQVITFIQQTQATSAEPDPTLSLILSNLQDQVSVGTFPYQALSTIGITIQHATSQKITLADGKTPGTYRLAGLLSIKTDVDPSTNLPSLTGALTNQFSSVQSMLTGTNGMMTKISNLLNTSTGTVYKSLNDPAYGSIPADTLRLKKVTQQITDARAKTAQTKKDLIRKYGELEQMMAKIQVQSQYLTQQIDVNSQG